MLTQIEITGEESFRYLREQLYLSGKVLARALEMLSLENGRVYTFVPADIPYEKLMQFNEGGLYAYEIEQNKKIPILVPVQNVARPIVQDMVLQYLAENASHCCIIEEPVGAPDDPWVKRNNMKYLFIGKEMYYFFNKDAEPGLFHQTFEHAEGYYFLCALGSLSIVEQKDFKPFHSLHMEQVAGFAETVSSFIVRGYDGEGYLQWFK